MTPISKAAQKTFDALVADLPVGEERVIGKPGGAIQPLHVERLTEHTYSLAHYYEQNGDLVPDPDGEFWRGDDGRVYPVSLRQCTGLYTEAMVLMPPPKCEVVGPPDVQLQVTAHCLAQIDPRKQRELASFAAMWLRNIRWQQEDYFTQPPSTDVLQAEPERGQA